MSLIAIGTFANNRQSRVQRSGFGFQGSRTLGRVYGPSRLSLAQNLLTYAAAYRSPHTSFVSLLGFSHRARVDTTCHRRSSIHPEDPAAKWGSGSDGRERESWCWVLVPVRNLASPRQPTSNATDHTHTGQYLPTGKQGRCRPAALPASLIPPAWPHVSPVSGSHLPRACSVHTHRAQVGYVV